MYYPIEWVAAAVTVVLLLVAILSGFFSLGVAQAELQPADLLR